MQYEVFTVGELATNCYLVWDGEDAVLIDPGDEADRLLAAISSHGLKLRAVLLTHLHVDHFVAVPQMLAATGAKLIVPAMEAPALTDPGRNLITLLPPERRFTLHADRLVEEGEEITVGRMTFIVWHTPGHTAGSACYVCGDWLFSGDTLFAGSVGRWDPPSGSFEAQRETMRRLRRERADLILLPGHGESSTLGTEQRDNPYMRG